MVLTRFGCGEMMAQIGAEANELKQYSCHIFIHEVWKP